MARYEVLARFRTGWRPVRKLIKKLGPVEKLRVCYEAGPTGYVLYWQLAELGVQCEVIAPSLVPVKAGDWVKTDRRDAEKLARSYRSGDLTAVWVPEEGSEALRDLVRACEAAKQDELWAGHRLGKFLLRSGHRPPTGVRALTHLHLIWVSQIRFTEMAQESTRLDYQPCQGRSKSGPVRRSKREPLEAAGIGGGEGLWSVAEEVVPPSYGSIHLELRGKVRISVEGHADPAAIRAVLEDLRG